MENKIRPNRTAAFFLWGLLAAVLLAGVLLLVQVSQTRKLQRELAGFSHSHRHVLELSGKLFLLADIRATTARLTVESGSDRWKQRYEEKTSALARALENLAPLLSRPDERALFERVRRAFQERTRLAAMAFRGGRNERRGEAIRLLEGAEYRRWGNEYQDGVGALLDHVHARIDAQDRNARRLSARGESVAVILLLVLAGFFGLLLLLFRREAAHRNRVETELSDRVRKATAHLEAAREKLEREIRERTAAEASLRESNERYRDLYIRTPAMLHSIDTEGRIIAVSDFWLERMGFHREEVLGRRLVDFLAPESRERAREVMRMFFQTGRCDRVPYEMVTQSGGILNVRLSATSERNPEGGVSHSLAIIEDVTDRLRAENALRESEERLNLVIRGGKMGFWDWDVETSRVFYNDRWAEILDLAPEEIGPNFDSWNDRLHPEDRKRCEDALERHFAGETPFFEMEHRLRTGDGDWRWVLGIGKVFETDGRGAPRRVAGIMMDISRQKEVEHRLLASERRFRNITLTSGDWIWEVDADGRYVYVSESVAAILGYTTEELLGRTPFELMPPGEGERIEAFFQRISANRAPIVDLENLNLHRDGSPVWLLTNGVPVQDDRGRLAGYFGVDKDITLRKQTEDALSLRLRELTALNVLSREVGAELSPASVFRKIFAGIREWVQPEQLLLFLPDDAGRMRLSDWHPDHLELRRGAPLSPPLETCLCHRAMTTGGIAASTDGEPPCCRLAAQLDGDAGPSAVAIPLGVGDRTVGLLQLMGQPSDALADSPEFLDSMAGIIASGIDKALLHQRVREQAERLEQTVAERTWELSDANARLRRENEERRKAQRELRAAKEEAEAANRTKSDFLARMSHEIRTPMNAILNMTELVRLTPLTGEQREHLESVAHSGQHLLNLINDILDISRIESGRLELETRDFNLVGLLRSTLGSMREQARKKGLYLELEIDDTFTPDLRGDPFRLQQILINLVGNAIKFTRSGGVTLGVTCRPDAECRPPSPEAGASTEIELRFQVADTGIGISPEVGEAVFDAFRQSDNSISRKYGGTGLGLAICHQLVFMMGGRLWFESLADGGTVFVFTVRLGPGTPGAEDGMDLPESLAGPSRRRPLDILLAEDNAENVRVARGLISKLGHRLTVAGNGMEALAKLRDEDFDVVLMDLEMPAMDGIEATRRIRNGEAGEAAKEVRIVALTAHALSGFREKCLAAGMDHYIAKPFSLAQLFGLLGRAKGAELSFSSGVSVSDGPVKGLDLEGAVGRLYGDEELYAELARAFLEKMPEKRERLRRLHRQSRWPELALIAHTLKGNCANIGAVACRRAAEALETASRDPHPPPASRLLRDLDDALEAARVDLSRWLENRKDRHSRKPEAPAEADAALTPEDLAALMDRLAEALSRGEVDDAAIDRLFSQPPDVLDPETLADLRRALDEFELERAGLRVQRLRLALLESPWEA